MSSINASPSHCRSVPPCSRRIAGFIAPGPGLSRIGIFGEDSVDAGSDPPAQGLALLARSVNQKSGPFDHRMDQARDELGDLIEVVRVGWRVGRGSSAL